MLPNCAAVDSRPVVCTFIWNCWSPAAGRAPTRPTGATVFWVLIALTMSLAETLRLVIRLLSNQMRIE